MQTEMCGRPAVLLLTLMLLSSVVFLYRLGERDLWTRLESEAAVVGRDMLDTGRFGVAHVFEDHPFVDNRPPGFFWLVAASYELTGRRDEWAARLPSALAATGCVLLVFLMGTRAASPNAGFLAGLVLLTIYGFVWEGRGSQQDMMLAFWTTLGVWAFWRSLDQSGAPAFGFVLLFQLAVGLGALTKGPAIGMTLVAPMAAAVLYTRRWRDVKWGALIATVAIAVGLAIAWYVHLWVQWPEQRDELIHRFTNQTSIHVKPIYYYLAKLPGTLGLVTLLLPVLVLGWRSADRAERRGPLGLFMVAIVAQLVIFGLFPSKRTHYLVPMMPMLALAVGYVIAVRQYDEGPYFTGMGLVLASVIPIGLTVALVVAPGAPHGGDAVVVLTGLAAVTWMLFRAGRRAASWRVAWISGILAMTFLLGALIPRLDGTRSARAFAQRVAATVPEDATLAMTKPHAGFVFYVGRPVQLIRPGKIDRFLRRPDHYLLIETDEPGLEEHRSRIILSQADYRHLNDSGYLLRGGRETVDRGSAAP